MSTGLDCRFVHVKRWDGFPPAAVRAWPEHVPSRWFYLLEQYSRRDEYDAYGPFASFDEALDHLDANHANPGGWSQPAEDAPPITPSAYLRSVLQGATR